MIYSNFFLPIILASQEIRNSIAQAPAGVDLESQYYEGNVIEDVIYEMEVKILGKRW
jgi:hypothetical protein